MHNIGIDMIEINRMSLKKEFIVRYLSNEEWNEFQKIEGEYSQMRFLAGRWALKEAIFKALPHEHLIFNQINITKNKFKQPEVQIKNYQIKLSLSHNNSDVIAIAIVF